MSDPWEVDDRSSAETMNVGTGPDLEAIFELASVGIAQADPGTGRFLRINRKYCEITGYSSDELMGMSFRDVTHPDDLDSDVDIFTRAVKGEIPEYFAEKRYIRRNGDVIWVSVNAVVVRDASNTPIRTIGVISDITERKCMEQRLAERTEEERRQLGHELHDSLGQQVTGIGMLSAALKRAVETSKSDMRPLVDKLEVSVNQAKLQVRSLMNGLFPVDIDGRGLPAALERLAADTERLFDVRCKVDSQIDSNLTSEFVATELYLIIREAVHNAAKHSQAKEILIQISDDEGLQVKVRDNGIGMAENRGDGFGCRIMTHRASLIGAHIDWLEAPEGGTLVQVRQVGPPPEFAFETRGT